MKPNLRFAPRPLAFLALAALGLPAAAAKIDPVLLAQLDQARGSQVDVVVYLSRQHTAEASARLAPVWQPRIDIAAEDLRQAAIALRPAGSLRPDEEVALAQSGRLQAGAERLRPLAARVDALRTAYQNAVVAQARAASTFDFAAARAWVASLGGRVTGETLVVSTLAVRVPADQVRRLASSPDVAMVGTDLEGRTELRYSGAALGAPTFWTNGVTGGQFDVGVLDTGVFQGHPAFAGWRFESNIGTTDSDGHGSHVGGIMGSRDTVLRGMAFGGDTMSVSRAGAESTSMSGMNWLMTGTTERAENVNYSFGNGTANASDYRPIDQFFDGVCDTFSVMVSKSTGNGGFSTGAPTITHPAPAFNLMAVASVWDTADTNRANDRISSFSSTGPTLAGRKKPDLATPGESIESCGRTGGFVSLSGTSMAAPHAGGSIVLLMDRGTPSPLAAKAVLINTADAIDSRNTSGTGDDTPIAGSFWDRRYGWGYANLSRAYTLAPDVQLRDLAAPAQGGRSFQLFRNFMFANEKATLAWNRVVAFNGNAYPSIVRNLSNLDLFGYRAATNASVGQSASTIDNVEQLSSNTEGDVVLKVAATGSFDPNVTSQRFALAGQEGLVPATGPVFTASFQSELTFIWSAPFRVWVTVRNTGDLSAFATSVRFDGYEILEGPQTVDLGTVLPGAETRLEWRVRRRLSVGNDPVRVTVSSDSYGEAWRWVLRERD